MAPWPQQHSPPPSATLPQFPLQDTQGFPIQLERGDRYGHARVKGRRKPGLGRMALCFWVFIWEEGEDS